MNNLILIISIAFVFIVVCLISWVMFKEIKHRKLTTNLRLPDINELSRQERISKMKESSDKYAYANLDKRKKIQEKDLKLEDKDYEAKKYLNEATKETSFIEDMGGLMTENGQLTETTPKLLKNNINLPLLDESQKTNMATKQEKN